MTRTLSLTLFWLLMTLSRSVTAIEIEDSVGSHRFTETPERVIALSWSAAENLIELGVKPLAIADVKGYNAWVVQPALPDGLKDVGARHQPSLERIARLKPDLIVVSSGQEAMIAKLKLIAPVLYFDDFRADHDNIAAARNTFLTLARLFKREEFAQQKLAEQNRAMMQMKRKVRSHFGGTPPSVDVVRLSDLSHVRIFDRNSLVHGALRALGLNESLQLPATNWGVSLHALTRLADSQGILMYIRPFPQEEKLFGLPLWQAMPFAQTNRVAGVDPAWTYGGISSRFYLAEHLTKALLELPSAATPLAALPEAAQ